MRAQMGSRSSRRRRRPRHRRGRELQQLGARAALQTRQHQALSDLDRAHALLGELRSTHQRAADTHRRCTAEIEATPTDPPRPMPVENGRVVGLAQWLQTLEATMAEGRWPSAAVGVTRWLAAAQEVLADEETVERTSSAPLDRARRAPRPAGRPPAARRTLAAGRPIDPGLEPLAQQAEDLLHRTPVPLADAAR